MFKKYFCVVLLISLCSACAPKNDLLLDMQKHSQSLYRYKVDASNENFIKHKNVLLELIDNAKKRGSRVPPGIYAEYAFHLFEEGLNTEAGEYFILEKTTYPESTVFMDKLLQSISKLERGKAKIEDGEVD